MAYRLKRGPKILGALAVAFAAFGGIRYGASHGLFAFKELASSVPSKAELPVLPETAAAPSHEAIAVEMPGTAPGCSDRQELRALVWAWNAQMGWMFANGGPRTTQGSLICKHGVNLEFVRQDDAEQMKAELLKFATEHRRGQAQPQGGAHFVAIMGDGSAQFLAALNPELARLGAGYQAHVIGSAGYSRGEDKFMGPPAWRNHAQAARGAYIAGYLKDGDWNIALKWAGDNGICNNPDDKVYDPQCLNWAAAKDYIDAAQKYVQGYCNELPLKHKRSEKRRVCVDSVVTWTPGDVIVAQKRGGLASIVSTREYASQMPNAIIGIEPWMSQNRPAVEGMLTALLEGGRLVKASPEALRRAAEISDSVYQEKNTGPEYWLRYFHGASETDKQGLTVQLGGSKVNDLGDNVALFGLQPGYANAFEATYTTFGRIVHEQYPADVPSFPSPSEVIDTSYLRAVLAKSGDKVAPATETASYATVSASPDKVELGRRTWKLNFDTGKDTFRPDARPVLTELMQGLIVAGSAAVEIHGHTDDVGSGATNQALSEKRAFAVKNWLKGAAAQNFPDHRFQIFAHGSGQPVESNDSDHGRAANRRVEIVLLSK
jgi:OmpA-OmpF porin, OOP family